MSADTRTISVQVPNEVYRALVLASTKARVSPAVLAAHLVRMGMVLTEKEHERLVARDSLWRRIRELARLNRSAEEIGRALKVSPATVGAALRRLGAQS